MLYLLAGFISVGAVGVKAIGSIDNSGRRCWSVWRRSYWCCFCQWGRKWIPSIGVLAIGVLAIDFEAFGVGAFGVIAIAFGANVPDSI